MDGILLDVINGKSNAMLTQEQSYRLQKIVNYTFNRFITEEESVVYFLKLLDEVANGNTIDVEFKEEQDENI